MAVAFPSMRTEKLFFSQSRGKAPSSPPSHAPVLAPPCAACGGGVDSVQPAQRLPSAVYDQGGLRPRTTTKDVRVRPLPVNALKSREGFPGRCRRLCLPDARLHQVNQQAPVVPRLSPPPSVYHHRKQTVTFLVFIQLSWKHLIQTSAT